MRALRSRHSCTNKCSVLVRVSSVCMRWCLFCFCLVGSHGLRLLSSGLGSFVVSVLIRVLRLSLSLSCLDVPTLRSLYRLAPFSVRRTATPPATCASSTDLVFFFVFVFVWSDLVWSSGLVVWPYLVFVFHPPIPPFQIWKCACMSTTTKCSTC
jgi:hypothetical protein